METAFARLFGVQKPYGSFQTRPAEYLLDGRNVILQSPTGSGKTMAALFPYLLARREGLDFPRKMLYCVPMRVLARSFYNDLKNNRQGDDLDARLQTGEQKDDPQLEAEITYATIDQVLSSFLNIPYSLSLRQGNVNAGAVVAAYLVFDEFHLLDPGTTLPTTLEMLRLLKEITPFLLMTATFSKEMLGRLAALLDAEVVTVSPEELKSIPSQKEKERRIHRVCGLLTAEEVLKHHRQRSIAICNTVERAQDLYRRLIELLSSRANGETRVILLHSRFLQEDRRKKEDEVRRLFGKDAEKAGSVILVATQVIEVGLDISCEVLHTEIAPASAILQRAGRCARFVAEKGDVYVYQVPPDKKGEPNYAPYLGQQAALCAKNWEALDFFTGKSMDFHAEQHLVNLVHGDFDAMLLANLEQAAYAHRKQMHKAIGWQEMGLARELIRSDDSVSLLVHPNPVEIENPYALESFSLFFGTLSGQLAKWRAEGLPDEKVSWLLKYPYEREEGESEDRPVCFEWLPVQDQRQVRYSSVFVVNPLLVQYNYELGFCFTPGAGDFQSPPGSIVPGEREKRRQWGYSRESYQQHVEKMLNVYHAQLTRELAYAADRLERRMGLHAGSLEYAVRLAIALHDVGKMDRRWQGWAHEWQRRIGAPVAEDFMIAHTDYDPGDPLHQAVEVQMPGARPPHAAEGAVATHKVIYQLLGAPGKNDPHFKLFRALFTAIARHHSPRADGYQSFALHPAARPTLALLLRGLGAEEKAAAALEISKNSRPVTGLLVQLDSQDELLAYFLLVRMLRLADQKAMGGRG
ncbi:MAG: CRISPR-associated helicase Cas3' [Bacillota bacterium]